MATISGDPLVTSAGAAVRGRPRTGPRPHPVSRWSWLWLLVGAGVPSPSGDRGTGVVRGHHPCTTAGRVRPGRARLPGRRGSGGISWLREAS